METPIMIGLDVVAITVLAFGIYFPRHHRRDLVVAFLGVNVGVLAVSIVLAESTIGAGLGLGLFGVLSIIRLRSSEIAQHEVAYYFAALALGLLAGLSAPSLLTVSLMALIVGVQAVVDHPRLLHRYRQQTIVVDSARHEESALRAELEALLGAEVVNLTVVRLDLVNDTTVVDVRYRIPRQAPGATGRIAQRADRTEGV